MRTLSVLLLSLLAIASLASAQTAQVQIIHNSPDPTAVVVDIYIDAGAAPAIDDFRFRNATPVLDLPAEVELLIGVAPGSSAGPGDIIATFPVTLMDGGSYLVMATGVLDPALPGNPEGENTDFGLKIFSPLTTTAPGGTVDLLAYHGAPNAPTVDIVVSGGGILIDDLTYGTFTNGYLNVPASDLVLQVTPGNDNDSVVASFEAPLSVLGGRGVVVFASGFLGGTEKPHLPAFGLFVALDDGTVIELALTTVAVEPTTWSGMKKFFE